MPFGLLTKQERRWMHPYLREYETGMFAVIQAQTNPADLLADKVRAGTMLAHCIIRHSEGYRELNPDTLAELRRSVGHFAVSNLSDPAEISVIAEQVAADYKASPAVMDLVGSLDNDGARFGSLLMFGLYGEHAATIIVPQTTPEAAPASEAEATADQA